MDNNQNRFDGLAAVYAAARPALPRYPAEVIRAYLGREPDTVVDLGCGTGLSTVVWLDFCKTVIGIEPNPDMLRAARAYAGDRVTFLHGFSHDTGLEPGSADAVGCA